MNAPPENLQPPF